MSHLTENQAAIPATVLIVEDSEGLSLLIQKRLTREGFRTEQAFNGAAALAKVAAYAQADVIMLLDYVLPDMDAKEVLATLRAHRLPVPFIIMTGQGDEQVAVEMMKFGARDYIVKREHFLENLPLVIKRVWREIEQARKLAEIEQFNRKVIASLPDGFAVITPQGIHLDVNPAFCQMTGFAREELLGVGLPHPYWPPEALPEIEPAFHNTLQGQFDNFALTFRRKNGERFPVLVSPSWIKDPQGQIVCYFATIKEMTVYKQAEQHQFLAAQILTLLNTFQERPQLIHNILQLIKDRTGIEAVGIRLREGDAFPYFETIGFPENFIEHAHSVRARTPPGESRRDSTGRPRLEGVCGEIILNDVNPALPFFTPGGSFWVNTAAAFQVAMPEYFAQPAFIEYCVKAGYESMAMIPLRSDQETIGVLQLNDHRPDRFTPEIIRFFEGMGASIGIALTRKQTEEQLRQLRKAVETMQLGVTVTNLDGRILYTNAADARMHGYQPEELIGQDVRLFAPPELRRPVALAEIQQWKGLNRESMNIRKDGSLFPVWLISEIIRDANGEPISLVTSCEDITERKRIEEDLHDHQIELELQYQELHAAQIKLRESYQKYADLYDFAPVGYCTLARNGRMAEANLTVARLLGVDRGQLLNTRFYHFIAKADRDRLFLHLRQFSPANPQQTCELRLIKPDGSQFFAQLDTILVPASTDRPRCYRTAISDITDRKQAEEALQKANAALEQRVEERTAELERASRHKDEFLANMSHELRTPLNAILGFAQLLTRADNLTTQQREELATIKSSGDHLLNMITDILDLAKIEAGRLELQAAEFSLSEFLRNLTNMLRFRAEQKGLRFEWEYDPDLPAGVRADETRLREVLLNVLNNAVKFTEKGRVTFRVQSVETGRRPVSTLRFTVEDTGIGMTPEQVQDLFVPFHQVGEARYAREGTGLGLAISHKLIAMMGGTLHVTSTLGQGSLFWFELSLPEAAGFVPQAPRAERKVIGYQGPRRTVLVVDDQPANRAVARGMLRAVGFHVIEAASGPEGLDKSRQFPPDVILLDLRMRGMDGFEVARRIRALEMPDAQHAKHSMIIAVSASTDEKTRTNSLIAGCDAFLAKPLQWDELLYCLQAYLHLAWTYQESLEEKTGPDVSVSSAVTSLSALPPAARNALCEYAVQGNVKAVLKQLVVIEQLGEQFVPLVGHLRTLAKHFQVDDIVEILETAEKNLVNLS